MKLGHRCKGLKGRPGHSPCLRNLSESSFEALNTHLVELVVLPPDLPVDDAPVVLVVVELQLDGDGDVHLVAGLAGGSHLNIFTITTKYFCNYNKIFLHRHYLIPAGVS